MEDLWQNPNQLSQEMVQCMEDIFIHLAKPIMISSRFSPNARTHSSRDSLGNYYFSIIIFWVIIFLLICKKFVDGFPSYGRSHGDKNHFWSLKHPWKVAVGWYWKIQLNNGGFFYFSKERIDWICCCSSAQVRVYAILHYSPLWTFFEPFIDCIIIYII